MVRKSQRQYLSAVMFIDVQSFTRAMHQDEENAIYQLEVIRRIVEKHHHVNDGRIIQYYGDGCLTIFSSVSSAVNCAIRIQREVYSRSVLPLRIGIHMGEIIEKDGAIYGEVVNTTARIEAAAPAGGILISENAFKNMRALNHIEMMDMGEMIFKNIDTPIRTYAVNSHGIASPISTRKDIGFVSKLAKSIRRVASGILA